MKNNKLLIGFLILGISIILVLNTRLDNTLAAKQVSTQPISSETPVTTSIGSQASDFTVTTLDKETFRLSEKKGKTVILFGMAGWCGTCVAEGRVLTKLKKEYADRGVEVIGVAFTQGDSEDFLREFKRLGQIDIPLALDTDNVAEKYHLTQLETTYIINKEGIIVYKDEQNTDENTYKEELERIL